MPFPKVSSIWYLVSGIRNTKYKIQNTKYRKPRGFTLIELLVVISLIGILSSFVAVSMTGAQQKARDAQRKSDLNQVRKVLELVKSECKGGGSYYPDATGATYPDNFIDLMSYLTNANLKYLDVSISDPKQTTGANRYGYADDDTNVTDVCPTAGSGGGFAREGTSNFVLYATLERNNDPDASTSRTRCAGKPGESTWNVAGKYVVCN